MLLLTPMATTLRVPFSDERINAAPQRIQKANNEVETSIPDYFLKHAEIAHVL